jgi:release factor glutamine methyltransferase
MDVRGALKEAMSRLRRGEVPSHTLAAELLLMHVTGRDRAWLYAHPEEPLDAALVERYFALVAERIAGTPTQYLTGKQEFWGLEFHVEPGVLIPRPETEHIVEIALERVGRPRRGEASVRGAGLRMADVGTGSGCLAVALAHELPGAEVFATDISAQALAIARDNAARHGARVHFVRCSLLEPFFAGELFEFSAGSARPFDLVVSNPPYIPRDEIAQLPRDVVGHEPDVALFGGADGSEYYGPLVNQAARVLRPGGHLVMELGYNTLERVRPLFDAWSAWKHIRVTQDLAGIARVIAAERA